ncbi:hypothetical protein [Actinacidiphila acididurans]|uniref:Uncharacterized protein n=1 Tax=Actinacidiphila acididurans TaxID=2784346 RepID=A0ABS2TIA9_9ACTN|nr:hypothetical protein [Actinacidiphila acididurans]MBM9503076.1 hypothetical protein [Actinacidiphila acididurans]
MSQGKAAGVHLFMVEVDRYTESAHVLADKVGAYADYYARCVHDPALPSSLVPRRTTAGGPGTVAHWQTLYPRTGLPGWPPLAIVLTGAGTAALDNRIRTVAGLSREHWAPERRAHLHYRADPDGPSAMAACTYADLRTTWVWARTIRA